jgi:hypothetical protein
MTIDGKAFAALLGALALLGCGSDNGTVGMADNPSQRGISADISASLDHGPTAVRPGMIGSEEPVGAFPWQINSGTGQ